MPAEQTDRVEVFTWPSGEDPFTRSQMNTSHLNIEARVATFLSGNFSARPAADVDTDRMFYLATDNGILYYCDGSNWFTLNSFSSPVSLEPGDTQSAGVATTLARSDHQHEMLPWGEQADIAAVSTSAAAGAATKYARADHVHILANDSVTAGKIATGGVSASGQLAAGVVESAAIAANAVTRSKIAETERMPTGSIIQFGGSSAPSGWLLCDGSVYSQASYADLFAVVGATYATGGEGGGNFRLPDLRGRVPVGAGTGTAATSTLKTLGDRSGAETVTLATTNLPSHTHGMSHDHTASTASAGTHNHAPPAGATHYVYSGFNSNAGLSFSSGGILGGTTGDAGAHTHSVTVATSAKTVTDAAGSGTAHENMQPYLVVNYIIKF
jgi:microcystin-dependent protein